MFTIGDLTQGRRRTPALTSAGIVAAVAIAGCGVSVTSAPHVAPKDTSGYRVLTGAVPLPLRGTGESAVPLGQLDSTSPPMYSNVPSASGRWFMTSSTSGSFRRTAKVELLATGHPGERFNLFWQESCGGTRVGKHEVLGGSGGEADLTLRVPALVLVKLPSKDGTYDMCYLAATVSMHTRDWNAATTAAPTIKVIHY